MSPSQHTFRKLAALPALAVAGSLALAGPAAALPPGGGSGPVNEPPVGRFTISPNPALVNSFPVVTARAAKVDVGDIGQFGSGGDTVTFNASASTDDEEIADYAWDLDGNGTFEVHGASAKVEKKKYFQTGTFTIKLKVTDDLGKTDVVSHQLVVRNPPHAAISSDLATPLVGQQVHYSAAGSTGDPAIASYQWDLDGNGTFETNSGTTPSASASYQSSGSRTVAVKVTDTDGHSATASLKETVNQAPIAAFTFAPSPAVAGKVVTFDGSSSSDDSKIVDYQWDLDGNGTFETDTKADPTAKTTYSTPGTTNVSLRVTDDLGVQSTVAHAVVVNPAPVTGQGTTGQGATGQGTTDTVAPRVTITTKSAKLSRKGTVAIRVACPTDEQSCIGRLNLRSVRRAHTSRLGGARFVMGGGQTATVHIRLSKANRRLVKRLHVLRSQATAVAQDAAGNAGTTTATVKIKK